MDVVVVREENHGVLTVATDYPSAIHFLVKNGWIDDETEVYDVSNLYSTDTILNLYGKNWREQMMQKWNLAKFNIVCGTYFNLQRIPLYKLTQS